MGSRLSIDEASIFDNVDERQVEFEAEVDAEDHSFAVQYDVLQALSGDAREGDAVELFHRFLDPILDAALGALARDQDDDLVIVGEADLE